MLTLFLCLFQTVIISIFVNYSFQIRPAFGAKIKLYRYYNGYDHFYTTDYGELGAGRSGWTLEGIQCEIETLGSYGASELHRYYNGVDHFYTTDFGELGAGGGGYGKEVSPGSCFASQSARAGLVPLYRYYNGLDHFYTTNYGELGAGRAGYGSEGIACYVHPFSGPGSVASSTFGGVDNGYYTISFGNSSVFTVIVCAVGGLSIVNIIMMVYKYCCKSSSSTKVAYKKVYMDSDGMDV